MFMSPLSRLKRAARPCAALGAIAALWAGIAQAQVPPPNDNIANAQGIIGVSGSVTGTNLSATAQTNEPAPVAGNPAQASIWYEWTAPITTTIDFNTRGSTLPGGFDLDTVLAVYTLKSGTNVSVTNLTVVAQNDDDFSGGVVSRVDFAAALGKTYLIQVDGSPKSTGTSSNATGVVVLNWGPSLVGGTFQFTTSLFPMGAYDDAFAVVPPNDLGPSLHNAVGTNNARITITRTGGYTGRCEMQVVVTNGFYDNILLTDFTGTNIFITNYDATGTVVLSYTNIFYTNTASIEEVENNEYGIIYYLYNYFATTNTLTVANGFSFGQSGIIPLGNLGTTPDFFTNFPCFPQAGPVFYVTNTTATTTNIMAMQTNVFCNATVTNDVTPSAIDGEDYMSSDSTNIIVFDDYQMSKDVYLNLPGDNIIGFGGGGEFLGGPNGPDYPTASGNYLIYGVNSVVQLSLIPVPGQVDAYGNPTLLDPLEDPDIVAPTISKTLGTSVMNVLNLADQPAQAFGSTNFQDFPYATINLERATFRINKPLPNTIQTNTIWVVRQPRGWPFSATVSYVIDTAPSDILIRTLNWDGFPAVAGSDYALPSVRNGNDFDFTPTYTGLSGTLTFPSGSEGLEPIQIVVTNTGAQEFDEDLYITLFDACSDASSDKTGITPFVYGPCQITAPGPEPALLGAIQNATVTINYNNPAPGVQPGGAWDRTYNVDSQSGSYPPQNPFPGANGPVEAIAIQGNGLPVIGGDFTAYNSTPDSHVARLLGNGQLDFAFNTALGSGPNGSVNAVAIDGIGRIYIGGQFTSFNGQSAFHIARLTPAGVFDQSFANANNAGFNGTVWALALDSNGNILAGGDFTSFNTTNCNHIARLLPSGGMDTSFLPSSGAPGKGTDKDVRAIAFDSNGNVIIGGDFSLVNGINLNYVARLTSTGALDTTFNPGVGPDNTVFGVAVQLNNSIIIAGAFANYNRVSRGSIARLTSTGALDTTFDPGTGANDVIYSLLLEPDGNIDIGGQFTSFNTSRRIGVARVLPSGWLDTSFMDTAYNQFAGLINHYYNVYAINIKDAPADANFWNIVSAMGYDNTGNLIIGGTFTRVGGGGTRDDVHFQHNLTRLISAPTPGPEPGGIGNQPGNITMTLNPYTVDDTAGKLDLTLDRVNGSLGPLMLTLGTNTFTPGPGAASQLDFGLGQATSTYDDIYNIPGATIFNGYGWRKSDGIYGFDYATQPDGDGNARMTLTIHNDKATTQNLFASLSLLNLTSFGQLTLGGETIPSAPALGQSGANLEIVNDNYPAGTLGFSATNYVVVNTSNQVTITVVRTNGNTGPVSVVYTTYNGFTNGEPGWISASAGVTPQNGDYIKTTGTLTFADGQTMTNFTVSIFNHSTLQPTKFFNIVLSNPNGGAVLDSNVPPFVPSNTVVEIIDGNFQPGHLEFSSPTFGVLKGSPALITVNRVGGASGQLTVQYTTGDGTGVNTVNYVGTSGTLTWNNQSVTPQTFTVQTLQDNVVEGAKTVNLSLFNPDVVGSSGGLTNQEVLAYPSNAVLTINDIDSYGIFSFSSPNFNVLQNAGQALITVVRTGGATGPVVVNYTTADGTNSTAPFQPAYAGTNYGAVNGSLSFGPGVTSQSFTVPVYFTPNESNAANRIVTLTLFNGSPAGVAGQFPQKGTLTILDNQLVLSPAGSVDQTTLNGLGFNDYVTSMDLQPDGNILASGNFTFFNTFPFDYVARLLVDGAYDPSFLNNLAGADATVYQVLSQTPGPGQTNGPVMIVGNFTQTDQVNRSGIARLNLDGSLDETFNPGAGADSIVFGIAEQLLPAAQTNLAPVPYYVICGNFANFNGFPSSGVARLTTGGQLDPNFNIGAGVSGSNAAVHVVAIQPNNQILVGGDFTSFNNTTHHHLVRLNVDGTVDTNFVAFDGIASDINGSVRTILIQPDSRILIGGLFTTVNGSNYNYIARLNADGTLDTNFNVGVGCDNSVLTLALDSQNRILVGGEFTHANGVTRNGITRLNPDGTIDPTINFGFGANGFVDAIAVQANDEIDVAGGFTTFNNIPENNFVRLYGGANAGDGALQFSQQIYGILESGTNATITIERLGGEGTAAQPTVSAVFFTSDGTALAGRDYTSVTDTVVFPYGETFETVTVPVIQNSIVAPDAIVNLNLTNAVYAGLGQQSSAQLIITNINAAVAFSANSYRQSADASTGQAAIPIVRIGNPNDTFTVVVYTGTNGTATPYTNYIPTTNILTFTPGVLTNYFLVPVLNAPNQFGDLTVDLEMNNATNAIVGSPSSALLTIGSVNNSPGVIAFASTNFVVSEGATYAQIIIVRTNGSLGTVTATLTTSNGTAVSGVNYSNVSTTVTFTDGQSSQTNYIPVIQQTLAGPDVTVLLTLSNPTGGATIAPPAQVTLTIQNDLENFSFGSSSYFVNENAGSVTISIYRNGPTNATAYVNYATYSPPGANDTNGYAVPNVDYTPTSGTLVFVPGQTFQTIPVNIIQGATVNGVETFELVLSNPSSGAQVGSPGTTTVGIISDVTGFNFPTNTYYVAENGSNIVITVNRINPNTGAVSVRFSTSDNNALNGIDYVATNGTLFFQNGQATNSFTVQILNPNVVENSKSFNLTLSDPSTNSYLVPPSTALVIITNVYTGVSFGAASFSVSECGVQATIPVIVTGLTNIATTVNFSTADGSGKANVNYITTNGTLTFQPGQTLQTFTVQVINNHVIGPDHTVLLNLSGAFGAQLLNPSTALLTIQECNGSFVVASGTAFVSGSIQPGTGVLYSNDVVTILFGLRDIAGGNTANLVATLIPTNGITNVSSPQDYGVLIENGPTKSEPFTFTALGSNGQNIVATLALQDGATSLGTAAFGFTIGGSTISFTNSQPLTFFGGTNPPTRATNSSPPGFGYPSLINVSGISGTITKVTATLTNFGHTFPSDINVVLEAPAGQDSILMSHCGISTSVDHLTLNFDQSATAYVPIASAITNGTYLPTTNFYEPMQSLPTVPTGESGVPAAPQLPYPVNMGVFVGTVPNGNWALWIDDDKTLDSGYLSNGWILNISSGSPVPNDADLELTATLSTTNVTLSNSFSYFVSVTNYGPAAASNVILSNTIPAGMAYVSDSCNCGTFANGVLAINYPSMAVGAGASVNITLVPVALGYATNIFAAIADQPNPNSNNVVVSTVLVSPPSADLGISMTEAPNPVLVGASITYTIVVTNNGPSGAAGVTASIVLPSGVSPATVSPSAGSASNANGTITWNIGTMGNNSTATLTVVATVRTAEIGLATATVSSLVYDPAKLNNFASVKTEIDSPAINFTSVGQTYTLTWPASANSYILQGAVNLPPLGQWVTVTPTPPVINGQYTFTLPGTSGYHFFRLVSQLP
jgi:uncharacterized repeat protein (TIGR01451 family)/uncharacterized delta-60 repeat protein